MAIVVKKFNDGLIGSICANNEVARQDFVKCDMREIFKLEQMHGERLLEQAVCRKMYIEKRNEIYKCGIDDGANNDEINRVLAFLPNPDTPKFDKYMKQVNSFKFVQKETDDKFLVPGEKMNMYEKKIVVLIFLYNSAKEEDDKTFIFESMFGLICECWNSISFIKIARKIKQSFVYFKHEKAKNYREKTWGRKKQQSSDHGEIVPATSGNVMSLIGVSEDHYIRVLIIMYRSFCQMENIIPIPKKEEMLFAIFEFGIIGNSRLHDIEYREFVHAIIAGDSEKVIKIIKGKEPHPYTSIMELLDVNPKDIKEFRKYFAKPVVIPGKPYVPTF